MSSTTAAGSWAERAEQYARDVLNGSIPACRWVRLAAKRHFDDKKRSLDRSWPYYFDAEEANAFCEFFEQLPHHKGRWLARGLRMRLEGWQCFIFCSLFGWQRRRRSEWTDNEGVKHERKLRRFREADVWCPRKNGKSPMAAGVGLYLWSMDGEAGAEVYCGAATEEQAWKVFGPAKIMLEKTPDFMEEVGAQPYAQKLVIAEDGSIMEPIIGKPGDGSAPNGALVDEWHEHQSSDQVDTMRTGMVGREQPLLFKISTAGTNLAGPAYEDWLTGEKILEGTFQDEERFVIIFTVDLVEYRDPVSGKMVPADDWASPQALRKANPNFAVSVDADILEADQRQAVLSASKQVAFKTKHLNIWCAAKLVWMPLEVWDACRDAELSLDEFLGRECWFILDLASKDDIAAYVKLFKQRGAKPGQELYYSFERYYLPEKAIERPGPNREAYRKWAAAGHLILTGEEEIDFATIQEDVEADKNLFQCIELIYDPWRATQLAQHFKKDGATVVEVRQTVMNLSAPMKEVLSASKGGRHRHTGNPVTRWMMGNVRAKEDAKENVFPRKEREKSPMKIDGAIGIIMGYSRAMHAVPDGFDDWLNAPVPGMKQ